MPARDRFFYEIRTGRFGTYKWKREPTISQRAEADARPLGEGSRATRQPQLGYAANGVQAFGKPLGSNARKSLFLVIAVAKS